MPVLWFFSKVSNYLPANFSKRDSVMGVFFARIIKRFKQYTYLLCSTLINSCYLHF